MIQRIIDWLIHLLGGYSHKDYYQLAKVNIDDICVKLEQLNRIERFIEQQLAIERQNYSELQKTFFKKLNIIPNGEDVTDNKETKYEPIQSARIPWPQRKRDLERQHSVRTDESIQTEERWAGKIQEETKEI